MENPIVFFLENIVFWGFVYSIVIMGCNTPVIVFSGFSLFFIYWVLRFLYKQNGENRFVWMYVINIFFTLYLFMYYSMGFTFSGYARMMLNSVSKQFPKAEPYLKRC